MRTSEHLAELATALAKAQGKIVGALKESANPFFKSKYADLASCWDACREQLTSNGLSVVQTAEWDAASEGGLVVTTRLMHTSGEWIEGTLAVMPKDSGPQAMGSAITYARRYALAAMVGLAQVDDDAEAAQGRPVTKISPVEEVTKDMSALEVKQASVTAEQMKDILKRDVFDEEKCLAVADLHDTLRTQAKLYTKASEFLGSKDRAYWKELVAKAHQIEKQELRPNGR